MGRTSPQGLTAQDFHHQPYVNPLDVFPGRSKLATRAQNYRSPIRNQATSRSTSRLAKDKYPYTCCGEDQEDALAFHGLAAPDCCVTFDHVSDDLINFDHPSPICCDEPHHNSPSPMDCEDCEDDCDDCVEEHVKAIQKPCHFVDDCDECNDEKTDGCADHLACQDTCDDCDFSCFDCVDWTEFEKDKTLGLSYSVPLLHGNGYTEPGFASPDMEFASMQPFDLPDNSPLVSAPPVDIPMHHQCFEQIAPYWNTIAQDQYCTGFAGLDAQLPLPPFVPNFGCHPAVAHLQRTQQSLQPAVPRSNPSIQQQPPGKISTTEPSADSLNSTRDLVAALASPATSRACQWLMPCGTVCGASFATGTDVKKHLKSVHLIKGVTKCRWQDCDAADFASEAALTGHISKKHLAFMVTATSSTHKHKHHTTHSIGEGNFKCTFPSCPKTFTYKHIRDEHVATHHGGNRMHCPICHVYINGEGSNFKRHMATHRPKHQHMLCRYHGIGCKRRFPRLDNLRRHEACCKFGKKARSDGVDAVDGVAGHHHHHHVQA